MYLRYGSYSHAIGEAAVTIRRTPLFNEGAHAYAVRERWEIDGFLQAATAGEVSAAIDALVLAYARPAQDLGLYFDDGGATSHVMVSAKALGGVRIVTAPSFPQGRGAEYSTFRSYRLAAEADFPDASVELLAWEETLSFAGGGARFVYLQTLTGRPQRQQVAEQTPTLALQSGRAAGLFGYPTPAAPIWPRAEHRDLRRVVMRSPRRFGPAGQPSWAEYEVTWRYWFEDAGPLAGTPGRWA